MITSAQLDCAARMVRELRRCPNEERSKAIVLLLTAYVQTEGELTVAALQRRYPEIAQKCFT